jgi:PAS domain S-box-containing protein
MSNLPDLTTAGKILRGIQRVQGGYLPENLLDMASVAIVACDREGRIIFHNRQALTLLAPFGCLSGLDGRTVATVETPMLAVLRSGLAAPNETIIIERADESRITASMSIDLLHNGAGEIVGAVSVIRQDAEGPDSNLLPPVRERPAHDLLDALPVAVYTTDTRGFISSYNRAAAELWGRHPVIGTELWCGSLRLYWPDGQPMPHDECPMAKALTDGFPRGPGEVVAERPDGSRVALLAYPAPLRDEHGQVTGAINTLVDITGRKRSEEATQLLASIVESSDDAILSKNLDGILMSWNRGAERLFGYKPEEVIGKSVTILMPPERYNEEPTILARIRRGERIDHYETVRKRKDGTLIDISLTVSPVRDAEGRVVGASKIARDITELRRARHERELLMRETNHRVKNMFTLASSIVTLSARSAESVAELGASIRGRLGALARSHILTLPDLTQEEGKAQPSTTLHSLLRTMVSPYETSEEGSEHVTITGPDVPVGGSSLTSFALLLHEFATNAAKYGALSAVDGRVTVDLAVEDDTLHLTWKEHGGPPVTEKPSTEGFGTTLARATVRGQLRGEITWDWKPEGLCVDLSVPLGRLSA